MDRSPLAPAPTLTVGRIVPESDRRRPPDARATPDDAPMLVFTLPRDDRFDSAAPVTVDAGTEAALADLKPVDSLPLDEAIHRYVDET